LVSTIDQIGTIKRFMTVRPIVEFPDPRLREIAEPVSVFDDALRQLATDLTETLRSASAIGIVAPHIGVLKRLVVIALATDMVPKIYVNPSILWVSPETRRHPEGSVSMPGVREEIERHARVRVRYQDLSGVEHIEEAEGLLAVCHQHEIDQLDGIFWIQRLSRLKRERLLKRYTKPHASLPARMIAPAVNKS
jgi:peptide deformylase